MAIENSITFGGVNSADYGIYISGEGVFNAPKRDVEMITIPGRNGEFALDQGRFENITVTYPAFNFEPNDYDTFAQNLSDFRNAICSQRGYQRLTDTFHPDEYRMAAYIGGLEIKPIKYNTASQFSIVFECKPQRFLTSGETAVTMTSGDTITNPTFFESSPMLEVTGYGNIGINDESIVLADVPLGEIKIGEAVPASQMTLDMTNVLTGDTIYQRVDGGVYEVTMHCVSSSASLNLQVTGYTDVASVVVSGNYSSTVKLTMKPAPFEGVAGTLKQSSSSVDLSFKITNGGTTTTTTGRFWVRQSYDGNNGFYAASGETDFPARSVLTLTKRSSISSVYAFSTVSVANYYIDLDIGEAYGKMDDEYYSLNSTVEFPSKLPTLKAGANTITYDNTITDFKIVPRWWKI